MQTIKVWWVPGNYINGPELHMNRGEALDLGGTAPPEYELLYDDKLAATTHHSYDAYRVSNANYPDINIPWCLSETEANRIADELGVPPHEEQPRHIMFAKLCMPYLRPLELPTRAYLYLGNRGPYTRLNLHPEINGTRRPGKLAFPDKSCLSDLCEGPCIITEIRDKENYCFFKGHMEQFFAPMDEHMDPYIESHNLYDCKLKYMRSKFGEYIIVVNVNKTNTTVLMLDSDGDVVEKPAGHFDFDKTATCTREISVADYICEGYHDCKFSELVAKFVKPAFHPAYAQYTKSTRYISDLFDDAVHHGFLLPRMFQNVFYIQLDECELLRHLTDYNRQEMAELIAVVNKTNQDANAAIRSKVKHGKIRLT